MAKVENLHLPADRHYDPAEHLWVKIEGGTARIGIDELGRWAAGTISYVDLHRIGKRLDRRGAPFGTLEANKFVGALRTPIRGTIVETNPRMAEDPRIVNQDAYGAGWFVVIQPAHLEEDLATLVRGESEIIRYAQTKVAEYRSRGILPDDDDADEIVVSTTSETGEPRNG
jgi:glycine cleavage system H protein